jgi:hypothetical protein
MYSGFLRLVGLQADTGVSEPRTALIFRIKKLHPGGLGSAEGENGTGFTSGYQGN